MDVLETVKQILAKKIDISNLKEDDSLASTGLDSLDLVEVALDIEDALGIEFNSEEIKNMKTLKDVAKIITEKSK